MTKISPSLLARTNAASFLLMSALLFAGVMESPPVRAQTPSQEQIPNQEKSQTPASTPTPPPTEAPSPTASEPSAPAGTATTQEAQASPRAPLPYPGESASQFFYYCQKTQAYYPNVTRCDEGWIAIPAYPPAPQPMAWGFFHPRATEETVRSQPNAVSLEVLGRALLFSLDYDRAISKHFSLGIGISSWDEDHWWDGYDSTITVVPAFVDYYFSESPGRGFVTAGVDWISVTQAGYDNGTFENNGFAGVVGGGYEVRDTSGFLLRLGGVLIVGRTVIVNPLASFGMAF